MLKKFRLTAYIIFASLTTLLSQEMEVRKIIPPKLGTNSLGPKVICYRPMRRGSPNISVEQKYGKIIVNNYGHGGSGWTLAPGSAEYAINLLVDSKYASDLKKDTPITIVGAGVIGLFAAYNLFTRGYKNLTIVAEKFDALTSHNSGGLIAPVSMDNNPQMEKIVYKIGLKAYNFYKAIVEKSNHDFTEGAFTLPSYFENRQDSGLESYVGAVMEPAKDVILDFGNGTTRKMVVYDDGIFVDVSKIMIALTNYLKKNKVKFIKKKINSFSQIRNKFIINCTGLGAKELCGDCQLVSVQGHLIMLKNQNPAELQYMIQIYLKDGTTKSGQKVKRAFYIFPKHLPNSGNNDVGVIGSTFIEGATSLTPNNEEFDIVCKNAKKFFGVR